MGSTAVGGEAGSAALVACREGAAGWAQIFRSRFYLCKSRESGRVMPVSRVSIMIRHTDGFLSTVSI